MIQHTFSRERITNARATRRRYRVGLALCCRRSGFRHLHPVAASLQANVGIGRTNGKSVTRVGLLNLTIEREACRKRDLKVRWLAMRTRRPISKTC